MKSTVLRKGIARKIFIAGGDPAKFPKINLEIPATPAFQMPPKDDDGEDDFSHIEDEKDRKVARLSRENNRRRLVNKAATGHIDKLVAENEALRKELGKVPQAQQAYDSVVDERQKDQSSMKDFAILRAIESDQVKNEKGEATPRAWYDVSMVRSLLNTDELAVDLSDFSIGGLSDQLDKIAKEKPFLVKEAGGKPDEGQQQRPPSGSAPQSSATGNPSQQKAATDEEMLADFPALKNLI